MADDTNIDPLDEILGDAPNQISLGIDNILQQQGISTPNQYRTNAPATYSMANRNAGNLAQSPTFPAPGEMNNYVKNAFRAAPMHVANPYKMGANTYYDASYTGANFDRYYTHPAFSRLDFNPWRDNESYYNKNSTSYEDWQRGNDQFFNLMWSGVKSGVRSWGDLFAGKPMFPDLETAEEQAKAMAVGYSSRGGVGAFTNNLVLNSAHTFGILAEMAMEEVALLGIGSLTGGSTFGVGAARFGSAMNKIAKGLPTVNKFGNAVKSTTKAFNGLNDINKARQFWSNTGKGFAKFINPLERTTDYVKGFRNADNITEFTKAHSFFGSFYRDVREINFALAESKLEGGLVANEVSAKLFNDFYKEHDRNPNIEEATEIASTAQKAGFATVGWNLPIILFSNKIVFDNMFRGFRPYTKAGGGALDHALGARLIYDRRAARKGLKNVFSFQEKNFKNFVKSLAMPGSYGRLGLSYLKANFAEGIQETFQEIIGGTATDYYTELYNNDPARGGIYANIGNNISKQFSHQGFEIFMSGFLMGGMVQPVISIPTYAAKALEYMSDKKAWADKKAQRKADRENIAGQLNDMYEDPFKYFAPDMENMSLNRRLAEGMNNAEKNGDRKRWQDLKDESIYNHVITAIQTGKMNFFMEHLEGMKKMNDQELKEAFGYSWDKVAVSKRDFHAKIDKTIERSKRIEARYQYVSERFNNPFNANKFDLGSKEWQDEAMKQLSYDNAVKRAVFLTHSFDRALERMNSIYEDISTDIPVKNASAHDFNILFDSKDQESELIFGAIYNEMNVLEKEIASYKEGDNTFRAIREAKKSKLKALRELRDAVESYKNNLEEESIHNAKVESGQLEIDFEQTDKYITSKEDVFNKYKNYLEVIARIKGSHVFNDQIESSFEKLMDYYSLENETKNLTNSINILLDPSGTPMIRSAERDAAIMEERFRRKKEDISKLLDDYENISDDNGLFQSLFEAGYFFDPSEAEIFKTERILPSTFYRVTDLEEISKDSHPEDWVKILDVVNKWGEVTGKPIPEASGSDFDTRGRKKYTKDKRTYKDYAEQFGFDPDASQTTVLQKAVLQSIIDDQELTTPRERRLAEELLARTSATDTINFVKDMAVPGVYDTHENEIAIDARYSSSDYTAGTEALEPTILHEIIHRLTVNGLNTDEEFKASIQALYDKTKTYYLSNVGKLGMPMYGLKKPREFVAEAMTNENFQKFLKGIKWDDAKTSAWTEFVKAVSDFLNNLLGIKNGNTVLDQTLAVTTEYIDGIDTGKLGPKDKTGPDLGFTSDTDITKLPPELVTKLEEGLAKFNTTQEANDEKAVTLDHFIKVTAAAKAIIANYNIELEVPTVKPVKKKKEKISADAKKLIKQIRDAENLTEKDLNSFIDESNKGVDSGRFNSEEHQAIILEIGKRRMEFDVSTGQISAAEVEALIDSDDVGTPVKVTAFTKDEIGIIKTKEGRKVLVVDANRYKKIGLKAEGQVGSMTIGDDDYRIIHLGRLPADRVDTENLIVDIEDSTVKTWLEEGELHAYEIVKLPKEVEDIDVSDMDLHILLHTKYNAIKNQKQLDAWEDKVMELIKKSTLAARDQITVNGRIFDGELLQDMYDDKFNELSQTTGIVSESTAFNDVKVGDTLVIKNPPEETGGPVTVLTAKPDKIIVTTEDGRELALDRKTYGDKIKIVNLKDFKAEELSDIITGEDAKNIEETKKIKEDEMEDIKKTEKDLEASKTKSDDDLINEIKNEDDCS